MIGQLQKDFDFICHDEPGNLVRIGLAVLRDEFFVCEFLGRAVERVTQAKWTAPGSRDLLSRALRCPNIWYSHAKLIVNELGVSILSKGDSFVGHGAYGRVLKVQTAEGGVGALKVILSKDRSECERSLKEFAIAQRAHDIGVVVSVWKCCKDVFDMNGMFGCGYTMEHRM